MIKKLFLVLVIQVIASISIADSSTKGMDVAYYSKLRFDFAARKDFSPAFDMGDDRKAIIDAFKAGRYDDCKELGAAWLKKVPVDAEVYLIIALSRKAKGDLAAYCAYMSDFYGFLRSITSTG